MRDKKARSFTLSEEIFSLMKKAAKAENRSLSNYVENKFRELLKTNNKAG